MTHSLARFELLALREHVSRGYISGRIDEVVSRFVSGDQPVDLLPQRFVAAAGLI